MEFRMNDDNDNRCECNTWEAEAIYFVSFIGVAYVDIGMVAKAHHVFF